MDRRTRWADAGFTAILGREGDGQRFGDAILFASKSLWPTLPVLIDFRTQLPDDGILCWWGTVGLAWGIS
jgi:hypothetical protein